MKKSSEEHLVICYLSWYHVVGYIPSSTNQGFYPASPLLYPGNMTTFNGLDKFNLKGTSSLYNHSRPMNVKYLEISIVSKHHDFTG